MRFMRNARQFRPLLVAVCFLHAFAATSQLQKIYLNPARTNGVARQADFVDSIRFLILDKAESNSGVPSGNTLQLTSKYFLITNSQDKKLSLYDRSGKFLRTIDYKSLGGNYAPSYRESSDEIIFFGYNNNYTLTRKDRIAIKLNWDRPRNRKYFRKYVVDLAEASPVIRKVAPSQYDIIGAYPLYGDYFAGTQVTTSELYRDSIDYEFRIYKDNRLVQGYFPYNRINEPRFLYEETNASYSSTDTPSVKYVTRPFCDTVYRLSGMEMKPVYQVVLPAENSLPVSFFTVPFDSRSERDNYKRNNGWKLNSIYNFYEGPKYLYMLMSFLSNYGTYIYNKQTKTTIQVRTIKPDKSQYNLTLLSDFGINRVGSIFYRLIKADELIQFFKTNTDVPVPADLQEFLKGNPDKNTPIIVTFKFKS